MVEGVLITNGHLPTSAVYPKLFQNPGWIRCRIAKRRHASTHLKKNTSVGVNPWSRRESLCLCAANKWTHPKQELLMNIRRMKVQSECNGHPTPLTLIRKSIFQTTSKYRVATLSSSPRLLNELKQGLF
ncbi:hypothetical protein TNCV_4336851 [Trichonephila clavipes]|nr:hypothetical protein TNCV_4336851 [Trichonephila clavipes]